MISEERKSQLVSAVEYDVNKYLSKQSIVYYAIEGAAEDEEEQEFLQNLNYSFEMYGE